jgi:REP-associated tyrosine transposase
MEPDSSSLRLNLLRQVIELPDGRLSELERWLASGMEKQEQPKCQSGVEPPHSKLEPQSKLALQSKSIPRVWPRAPVHHLSERGTFFVTTGTLHNQHLFADAERRDILQSTLLELAEEHGWNLEAWAVFANHYHFVGYSHDGSSPLNTFLGHLHTVTATEINRLDQELERQVWHNFRETQLTFEKSYLARLNYVHQNAVHHGLVPVANQYPWCSAAWFERTATRAQVATIYGFKIDRVQVDDDFDV